MLLWITTSTNKRTELLQTGNLHTVCKEDWTSPNKRPSSSMQRRTELLLNYNTEVKEDWSSLSFQIHHEDWTSPKHYHSFNKEDWSSPTANMSKYSINKQSFAGNSKLRVLEFAVVHYGALNIITAAHISSQQIINDAICRFRDEIIHNAHIRHRINRTWSWYSISRILLFDEMIRYSDDEIKANDPNIQQLRPKHQSKPNPK